MVEYEIIKNLLVALALGALIGLEREYARYRNKGHEFAGIRTFPLISLFGALSAYFGKIISPWILIVGMIMVGILAIVAYFIISKHNRKYIGATTEVAGFLAFFIGVLAFYGELVFAVILAVTITIILYARSFLHNFAKRMKKEEMVDTLKFAVIAFLILPFLPNKGYGHLELFNPYLIWLMVVFISGISFIGYILMNTMKERGITLMGILGGMVSSAATTISFSERSRKDKKISRALALGVILANGVMFIRIVLIAGVINKDLANAVLIPIIILASATAIFSYVLWKRIKKVKSKIKLSSPFRLVPALKFGLFFAAILALVKLANFYLSYKGVYLVSFFSGFADVDAITISLSQLSNSSLPLETAKNGILMAAMTNIATKGGIALWMGRKEFGRIIIWFFAFLILLGIGLMFLF